MHGTLRLKSKDTLIGTNQTLKSVLQESGSPGWYNPTPYTQTPGPRLAPTHQTRQIFIAMYTASTKHWPAVCTLSQQEPCALPAAALLHAAAPRLHSAPAALHKLQDWHCPVHRLLGSKVCLLGSQSWQLNPGLLLQDLQSCRRLLRSGKSVESDCDCPPLVVCVV